MSAEFSKADQARLGQCNAALETEAERLRAMSNADRFDIVVVKARLIRDKKKKGRVQLCEGAVAWQRRDGSNIVSLKDDPAQGDFDHKLCCGQVYKLKSAQLTAHEGSAFHRVNTKQAAISDLKQSTWPIPHDLAFLGLNPLPMPSGLPDDYHLPW